MQTELEQLRGEVEQLRVQVNGQYHSARIVRQITARLADRLDALLVKPTAQEAQGNGAGSSTEARERITA